MSSRRNRKSKRRSEIIDVLSDVLEDKVMYRRGATALLDSGWDFKDSIGKCDKPAEEIEDFLETLENELGKYSEMYPSRRNLFKMIIDMYMRS